MNTVFIQIRCKPGKTYYVADEIALRETFAELYSTSGDYDLLLKLYIPEGQDTGRFINDYILDIEGIERLAPAGICISPGPCSPKEAGISMKVIEHFAGKLPIFGVCLGQQSIGAVFGGDVVRAEKVMHGKTSAVHHTGQGVFKNLPSPFNATRYHSLVVAEASLPDCLEITAWTETPDGDREAIMGLRHRELAVEGVQFHPESILSEHGHALLQNFLDRL